MSKSRFVRRLDALLPESAAGEVARRARPRAAAGDQGLGPLGLRVESGDRGFDLRLVDPLGAQAVPDRLVPPAPAGERFRPRLGDPHVIDEAGACERRQRLGRDGRRDRPLLEPFGQPPPREVPGPEGATCNGKRLGTAELTAHDAEGRTIEHPPFEELCSNDDVNGKDAPRRAVECDRHAAAAVLA